MKKIILSAVACGLMGAGWLLLITAKSRAQETPPPKLVVDTNAYCDDRAYVENGISEDSETTSQPLVDLASLMSEKPLGPEECFSEINDGQTLHSILRPHGVSEQEIALLSDALKPHLRARDLAAKDQYRFKISDIDRSIDHIVIRKIDPHRIPIVYRATRVNKNSNPFLVSVIAPPVSEKTELIELTVSGTLYQTFSKIPFGTELMQRVMGIFTWQMRMPKDVLPGDHIEILVAKRSIHGDFIGYGKIEAVLYHQKSRTLAALYFKSSDGKIQGYFNENGNSIEKEFAVSPVQETTATSNQKLRLHPVRKIRIRHNGIDFRGSIGTAFYSIADGEVIEKRFDVNVGNMIRIRHKYGVHSEYFHADSLAENISVGQRVSRGQFLGAIGRTGRLCTGPHLHLGLYTLNGEKKKFIDLTSLRSTLKSAPDISPAYASAFMQQQKALRAELAKQKAPALAGANAVAPVVTK